MPNPLPSRPTTLTKISNVKLGLGVVPLSYNDNKAEIALQEVK